MLFTVAAELGVNLGARGTPGVDCLRTLSNQALGLLHTSLFGGPYEGDAKRIGLQGLGIVQPMKADATDTCRREAWSGRAE